MITKKVKHFGGPISLGILDKVSVLLGEALHVYVEREEIPKVISWHVGDKVIVRSNEAGPLLTGFIVVEDTFPNHSTATPTWVCEQSNKEHTGGCVFLYSDKLYRTLLRLTWWEQWNVLTGGRAHVLTTEEAFVKMTARLKELRASIETQSGISACDPSLLTELTYLKRFEEGFHGNDE